MVFLDTLERGEKAKRKRQLGCLTLQIHTAHFSQKKVLSQQKYSAFLTTSVSQTVYINWI